MKTAKPNEPNAASSTSTTSSSVEAHEQTETISDVILPAMEKIDPFLRFLTKATGKTSVPVKLLHQVLPKTRNAENTDADAVGNNNANSNPSSEKTNHKEKGHGEDYSHLNEILLELTHRGILYYQPSKQTVGFPLPPSPSNSKNSSTTTTATSATNQSKASTTTHYALQTPPSKLIGKGLHTSSEPTAKRRMKVLKWTLERVPYWICRHKESEDNGEKTHNNDAPNNSKPKAKKRSSKKRVASKSKSDGVAESTQIEKGKRMREDDSNNGGKNEQPHQDGSIENNEMLDECNDRRSAYRALDALMRGSSNNNSLNEKKNAASMDTTTGANDNSTIDDKHTTSLKQWLPCQAAFAGSRPGRRVRHGTLSKETMAKIPSDIVQLFDLDLDGRGSISDVGKAATPLLKQSKRRLFLHQARAIESAMNNIHTVVQTATGSGKSFCFLLPVLAKAMMSMQQQLMERGAESNTGSAAILIFPTKALAQDQYSKINALLQSLPTNNNTLGFPLRAGVIDGDTPHQQRDDIATDCQIILTNPDTLHASILPNWKKKKAYQSLLARISTVVVDEAHVYEGAFGAHVAMVLARLKRVCRVASSPSNTTKSSGDSGTIMRRISPLFIACSATMLHPEQHFRLLCPIGKEEEVCVLTSEDDGSPCAPKHFFVWNPPILDVNGNSTESVFLPKKPTANGMDDDAVGNLDERPVVNITIGARRRKRRRNFKDDNAKAENAPSHHYSNLFTRRRHAADETAFLLAKAISSGVRTIAFCKTRSLVEWVYERTLANLQSNPETSHLTSKVESYRGGYTAEARRSIEERLFQRKLWGVVGTNALELGVDVGGVDLTLHTGYPGSISSLLQQSGRAGRGKGGPEVPSCAIMIVFSSPSEQHIWKNPSSLLSKGVDAPPTLPINGTVMQGHLLCAGEEIPLTGDRPVSCLLNEFGSRESCPADCELLGPTNVYQDNVEFLEKKGLLSKKIVNTISASLENNKSDGVRSVAVYSTHPVVKHPWKRVSLRSIEPLSYSIVDLSHNLQGGKTDKIHNPAAVMDTIPYSRVFYHAFPGSIIMHRGRKYRIESMESPPPFVGGASFGPCGCSNLMAFAKPTSLQYCTQALSINQITVVKKMEQAEVSVKCKGDTSFKISDNEKQYEEEGKSENILNDEAAATTAVAGNGVVTVKRTVHGYKKLSHVNRKELSRTTISLPSMEFDTYALWIDADAAYLKDVVFNFDGGVHALSHAMVAVAPLFVSCTSSDIDCDHGRYDCTRILIYDQRAGGSGVTAQLYGFLVQTLQAAVNLLEECTSCYSIKDYDGGCPACLQSVPCDNFHQDLSRSAGIRVGKHLIRRLENSNLKSGKDQLKEGAPVKIDSRVQSEPRSTNDMQSSTKPKNIVIGRASWMENNKRARWAEVDE